MFYFKNNLKLGFMLNTKGYRMKLSKTANSVQCSFFPTSLFLTSSVVKRAFVLAKSLQHEWQLFKVVRLDLLSRPLVVVLDVLDDFIKNYTKVFYIARYWNAFEGRKIFTFQ